MRKRWLIGGLALLAVLAVAYTGYWFWLARTFEQQLALWIDQQRAMGYRVTYGTLDRAGSPFDLSMTMKNVAIESPPSASPWQFRSAQLTLSLAPWNPLTLRLDDGRKDVSYDLTVGSEPARRSYRISSAGRDTAIRLSLDGTGATLMLRGDPIAVDQGGERRADIDGLRGTIELSAPATAEAVTATVDLHIDRASIGDMKDSPFGQSLHDLQLVGQIKGVLLPEPLPQALASWSDGGGTVDVTAIAGRWGPLSLNGDGTLALDRQLQPIGAFTATLRGFNETVDAAVAAGLMTPAQGTGAKLWLNAKAQIDDAGPKVKLPITIQDGFVSTGPVKLAQLPPIIWQ